MATAICSEADGATIRSSGTTITGIEAAARSRRAVVPVDALRNDLRRGAPIMIASASSSSATRTRTSEGDPYSMKEVNDAPAERNSPQPSSCRVPHASSAWLPAGVADKRMPHAAASIACTAMMSARSTVASRAVHADAGPRVLRAVIPITRRRDRQGRFERGTTRRPVSLSSTQFRLRERRAMALGCSAAP